MAQTAVRMIPTYFVHSAVTTVITDVTLILSAADSLIHILE